MSNQVLEQELVAKPGDTKTKLKTLFVTLPQRDTAGTFPPYGALAVMTYLKKLGYVNLSFYNMDLLRPSRKEAIDYIVSYNPDVLCISAPVSTSYENCKYYSLELKKRLPQLKIVLGGNLAASAEIILKKTGVDICVLGEGEIACKELFDVLSGNRPKSELSKIKGLGYLEGGEFINTGHAEQLPMDQVYDVDWSILDEHSREHCFQKFEDFALDSGQIKYFYGIRGETIAPSMLEKKISIIACSKGCVARCTFCHRWQKGIRFIPPEILIGRMKYLMENYNVGFFEFADECFGADLKWLHKFCEMVKPLNILWNTAGMRVKQMTPAIIAMMKEAGCRSIIYGMETGSEKMIEIMEKRAAIEDNIRAFRLTIEAGLNTIPQLIIGMPGETHETILESADFIARNITLDESQNPREVSINFAQALPGTPLYEYARHKGMIGESIDEEEKYLLHISDRNACDEATTLNFTEYSRLTLLSWRNVILCIVKYEYMKKFGLKYYYKIMFNGKKRPTLFSMIKNKQFGLILDSYPRLAYRLRRFMWALKWIDSCKRYGFRQAFRFLGQHIVVSIKRILKKPSPFEYKSLRKIVEKDIKEPFKGSKAMVPLRIGR